MTEPITIISRKEAKAQGLKRYFTGKPCKHGHISPRYTTGPCVACVSPASPTSWASKNPEKRKESLKRYDRSEKGRAYTARWREANREDLRAYHTQWREGNDAYKEAKRIYHRGWRREKLQTDMQYAMVKRLRDRLACVLRAKDLRAYKAASILELMGCTKSYLVAHLEAQFLPGMTWENRSLWEIDHIRPLASFDLRDPEQQRAANHFSNLQPLWWEDNLRKGAKL